MIKKIIFTALLSACIVSSLTARDSVLTEGLKNGMGIRALSMGDSFSAVAEGAEALHYNPAGLVVRGGYYSYQNMDYKKNFYEENRIHSVYAGPLAYSNRSIRDLNNNTFGMSMFGFGHRSQNGVDWGLTYKTIDTEINGVSESGWSTDLGMLIRLFPSIDIGVVGKDILDKDIEVPSSYTVGWAYHTSRRGLIVSNDWVHKRDETGDSDILGRVGLEYHVSEGLILRGGWFENNYTGGVGLIFPLLEVNYGVVSPQEKGTDPQLMLGFKLGKGLSRNRLRKRYSIFKQQAYAQFSLGQNLTTGKSEVSLFGGSKIGSNDLIQLIHIAANDRTCKGFIIRVGSLGSSLGSVALIQELRTELKRAKDNGKDVIVYIENWATLSEYYLASVADYVTMPELGTISHLGLEVEVRKTTKMLNNFGITPQVITSGYQKGALSSNTPDLDPIARMQLESLIGGMYQEVISDIKASRDLNWEEAKKVFDGRIITAREAKKLGLIDGLGYFDSVNEYIRPKHESLQQRVPAKLALTEFIPDKEGPSLLYMFNRIAVIEIDGPIMSGRNTTNFLFGGKGTGADDIEQMIAAVARDFTIKGVILRVNSPGGSMLASDQIYKAVEKLKRSGKLVYTSMGNIAASGGYYVALNSNRIIANPTTLTGSIGVISAFNITKDLSDTLGIEYESIKTGKYMDLMSKNTPLTEDKKQMLVKYQENYYQAFVDRLIENRNLTESEAYDIAQGQVFSGEEAKKLNIIDDVGGFYDAVDILSKDLEIDNPKLVFVRPQPRTLLPVPGIGLFSKLAFWKYLL